MHTQILTLFFLLALPAGQAAENVTVDTGPLQFTVRHDGGGFVDEVVFQGRKVVGPNDGLEVPFRKVVPRGAFLEMFRPQPDEGLASHAVLGETVPAQVIIDRVERQREGQEIVVTTHGQYRFASPSLNSPPSEGGAGGGVKGADFTTTIRTYDGESTLRVEHTITFFPPKPERPGGATLLRSLGLSLPVCLGEDRSRIRLWAGGEKRDERWWVNPNPVLWHHGWMLSDNQERWPLWRIGGLLHDSPNHYRIWKANRPDTAPLTVDEGVRAPGWFDLSDDTWGVTVVWEKMAEDAPSGVAIDTEQGLVEMYFHPPQVELASLPLMRRGTTSPTPSLARGGSEREPLTFAFELHFHEDIFPTTRPREMSREAYGRLVRAVIEADLFNYISYYFTIRRDGTTEDKIRWTVDSGFQPSQVLEIMNLGNGWRLNQLCQHLGAVPYRADAREEVVKELFDFFAQSRNSGELKGG